jgi:predicted Fe-Mo cluster-binding NifX family protein
MRIAIPAWNGRISPVFDVARSIRVIDITDGGVTHTKNHALKNESRAAKLVELGIDLLICAAISTPLEATMWVSGIEVISDICGTVEEIVEAFSSGDRELTRFRSPGITSSHRSLTEISSHHRSKPRAPR